MMRIRLRGLAWIGLVALLVPAVGVSAAETLPDVVVFYREGCNDCRHMDEVLEELYAQYPNLVISHIEETDPGASDLMWTLATKYGIFPSKFPVIFVGDEALVGTGRDKELRLRAAVRDCVFNGCESPISQVSEKPFPWITAASLLVALLVAAIILLQ